MYILYAHHNDSYIKIPASTFSLVASLTSFCNALYLRAVLIRHFLLFPCLYLFNNPCFQHLKKRCNPYKIAFANIHFLLYFCIVPHTKFSYAIFLYLFLSFVLIQKKETKKKSSLQIKSYKITARYASENECSPINLMTYLSNCRRYRKQ